MALPLLNEVPKYDIIIPSTGEKTTFRPYLVKEEKILLMASESNDEETIAKATIELIKHCVNLKIDEKQLTDFDMEYLFCQIRSKSVGETSKMQMNCTHEDCSEGTEVDVPLDKVYVNTDKDVSSIIDITDNVKVEMRYLTYYDYLNNDMLKNKETESELIFNIILSSIKSIMTDEDKIDTKDEPIEELINFVNSMTTTQFNKLKYFVENAPQVSLNINWTCESCKRENGLIVKGIMDFF